MTYTANLFALKHPEAWRISLALHGLAWLAQFAGHLFLEKRLPALLSSLSQALLTAPLFVFMELLFLVGYRPALQKRLREKTRASMQQAGRLRSVKSD